MIWAVAVLSTLVIRVSPPLESIKKSAYSLISRDTVSEKGIPVSVNNTVSWPSSDSDSQSADTGVAAGGSQRVLLEDGAPVSPKTESRSPDLTIPKASQLGAPEEKENSPDLMVFRKAEAVFSKTESRSPDLSIPKASQPGAPEEKENSPDLMVFRKAEAVSPKTESRSPDLTISKASQPGAPEEKENSPDLMVFRKAEAVSPKTESRSPDLSIPKASQSGPPEEKENSPDLMVFRKAEAVSSKTESPSPDLTIPKAVQPRAPEEKDRSPILTNPGQAPLAKREKDSISAGVTFPDKTTIGKTNTTQTYSPPLSTGAEKTDPVEKKETALTVDSATSAGNGVLNVSQPFSEKQTIASLDDMRDSWNRGKKPDPVSSSTMDHSETNKEQSLTPSSVIGQTAALAVGKKKEIVAEPVVVDPTVFPLADKQDSSNAGRKSELVSSIVVSHSPTDNEPSPNMPNLEPGEVNKTRLGLIPGIDRITSQGNYIQSVEWENIAFKGTDRQGNTAEMALLVLSGEFYWRFGGLNIINKNGQTLHLVDHLASASLRSIFSYSTGVVCIGTASEEGDLELEEYRAGMRANLLVGWIMATQPQIKAVFALRLGQYQKESHTRTKKDNDLSSEDQRRIILININQRPPSINLAEAVKNGLSRLPVLPFELERFSTFDFKDGASVF